MKIIWEGARYLSNENINIQGQEKGIEEKKTKNFQPKVFGDALFI